MRNVDLTFTPTLASVTSNAYGLGWLPQQDVVINSGPTPTTPAPARLAMALYSGSAQVLTSYALVSPADGGTLTYPPTFDNKGGTIGVFNALRCRFAAFGPELYGVQDQNNIANYRMLANGDWYNMGLQTMNALTVALRTPGGPQNPTGNRTYVFTTVDNQGRESSPSPPSSVLAFGGGLTDVGDITMPIGFNTTFADVVSANIYATTGNGALYYKIGSTTNKGGGVVLTDNFTDAQVAAGASAPNFGQNDPPLPASIITTHKNYVILNVNSDANSIQISNFGSATQFSTTGLLLDVNQQVTNPNDGITLQISSDSGNDVTGLASLGSVLCIGRRRSTWVLFGDSIVDFIPRKVSDHGNVSPDAMIRCDNEVLFLSQDGVYAIGQQFEVQKISGDLDDKFYTLMSTTAGIASMYAATAFFVQRHYVLCIGTSMYAFNVDTRKWLTISVGVTVNCAVVAYPPNSPALALMGRTDAQKISLLDLISQNVATTGMSVRTRFLDFTMPSKERNEIGMQEPRAAQKRLARWRIFGSGTSMSGTVVVTVDGRTQTYTLASIESDSAQGILFSQEFPASATGRAFDITVNLAGTGVELSDQLIEAVLVG